MARDRTRYPALALWRAEVGAGLDGQDVADPTTWKRDALWQAAWFEVEAMALEDRGNHAGALAEIIRARQQFLPTGPTHDSRYRKALHGRAMQRLGATAAQELSLRSRPRGDR